MAFNSDYFDLQNWKITLPVDKSGKTKGEALEAKNLIGYENSDYFYDTADGAMVFRATADGATTSGSKYARSELREMDGKELAAWSLKQGGTMSATLTVDEVPTYKDGSPGRVIVGQIHGQDDELVRLYYEQGRVYFMNEHAGSKNQEMAFTFKNAAGKEPDIALGEKFSYLIDARGDTLTVKILADGQEYSSVSSINSVWQSDTFYFKAGIYMGVNESNGKGVGQVSFYGLDIGHTSGAGLDGWNASGDHIPQPEQDPAPTIPSDEDEDSDSGSDETPAPQPEPAKPSQGADIDNDIWKNAGDGGKWVSGNSSSDTLAGSDKGDTVKGRNGNDALVGGAGDDYLEGNNGNDTLHGGTGNDVLKGSNDIDTFVFQPGDGIDHILDYSQGEKIDVSAFGFTSYAQFLQSVTLESTSDGLVIDFGNGDKLLASGLEMENLPSSLKLASGGSLPGTGGASVPLPVPPAKIWSWQDLLDSDDVVKTGKSSADWMNGSNKDDVFDGDAGNDTLKGRKGDDFLHGGAGDDYLEGNNGNDLLIGSLGKDTLKGGEDADTFAYTSVREGGDTILDFRGGDGDKLDLSLLVKNSLQGVHPGDYFDGGYVVLEDISSTTHRVLVDVDGAAGAEKPTLIATVFGDMTEGDFVF